MKKILQPRSKFLQLKKLSKSIMMELLRKCLIVSASAYNELMDSAIHIAQLTGDKYLAGKLSKLSSLVSSNLDVTEGDAPCVNSNNLFKQQEQSISRAAKELELIKRRKTKSKVVTRTDVHAGNSNRWVVAESWNSCPIGMLPRAVGSSGFLPILDLNNIQEKVPELLLGRKEKWELRWFSCKREASSDTQLPDNPCFKKRKQTVYGCVLDGEDVLSKIVNSHLMIGGVWKKVGEEELLALKSAVRILI